jgi:hypothetical protein
MATVTYIGDPMTGDGPHSTTLWGHVLVKHQPTEIDDETAIEKARRNSHFAVDGETAPRALPEPIPPEPEPVPDVPDDWQALHWKQKVKLAKQVAPDLAEAITTVDDAEAILEAHAHDDEDE